MWHQVTLFEFHFELSVETDVTWPYATRQSHVAWAHCMNLGNLTPFSFSNKAHKTTKKGMYCGGAFFCSIGFSFDPVFFSAPCFNKSVPTNPVSDEKFRWNIRAKFSGKRNVRWHHGLRDAVVFNRGIRRIWIDVCKITVCQARISLTVSLHMSQMWGVLWSRQTKGIWNAPAEEWALLWPPKDFSTCNKKTFEHDRWLYK